MVKSSSGSSWIAVSLSKISKEQLQSIAQDSTKDPHKPRQSEQTLSQRVGALPASRAYGADAVDLISYYRKKASRNLLQSPLAMYPSEGRQK